MITPEKNDVDINRLFRWGDKFSISGLDGTSIDIYMRVVGDAELNRARVYGLRKSAELRRKLRQENSDEHIAYIPDEGELSKEKLIAYQMYIQTKDITKEAIENVKVAFPKELKSDATLEDQEEYQREVDEYTEEVNKQIDEFVSVKRAKLFERLSDQDAKTLYYDYVELLINDLCEAEMYNGYKDMCIYFGTYNDADYTHRLFRNIDEYLTLPGKAKADLEACYSRLELTIDELKK